MGELRQAEKSSSEEVRQARSSDPVSATRAGIVAGEASAGYQRARLDPRGLSPSAFFALQRTAGNRAVNSLLRGFAERGSNAADSVSVQRDPPAAGGGTEPSAAGPAADGGSSGAPGPQQADLQLPPPAPQQVPADQIASVDPAADPAGAQPDSAAPGGGTDAADPDTGEVDLVRTTTNARTGEHTIDFTANFHLPDFHLPAFSVLGRQVQPFDDPSVFVQLSFDPSGLGAGGGAPSYSQIHSTLVGVSTSALNAHIFSLHGREFFDIALPVSLGVQNDATGMSANAQAGVQASVNVTRALSITATVNGQANIPLGGGPATFSFAGVSVGVGGKF